MALVGVDYERLSQDRYGTSPNIEIQRDEIHAFLESEGIEHAGCFSDNDLSASKFSKKPRPGYQALLVALQADIADVLVVTEISRLLRQIKEALEFLSLTENTRLRRIVTTNGKTFNLHTVQGVHDLIDAVNDTEIEPGQISQRLKRKRRALAKEGHPHGGTRAYGWEKGGMVPIEFEAAVINDCLDRVIAFEPINTIKADLNKRGVRTAQGGLWTATVLKRTLLNPKHAGIRMHFGVAYPGKQPAIVDPEKQERARVVLSAAERFKGANKKGIRAYLLGGILYCGLCGKPLVASGGQYGRRYRGRRYRCRRINVYGMQHGCGKIARLAEPVELLVTEAVLLRYNSPAFADALAHAPSPDQAELSTLRAEENSAASRYREVEALYSSGQLGAEEMIRIKGMIEEARAEIRSRMAKLETGRLLISLPSGKKLREAWERADLDTRRQLVSLLVERVELLPSRQGGHRWTHEPSGKTFVFDPERVRIKWRV